MDEGRGCIYLGAFYATGAGVRQDYQQAKTYFEKACNLDDGGGCIVLGRLYDTPGIGVTTDAKKAKEYYGKACDLGEQQGCDEYRKFNEQGY